jgi:hypothetical protein
MILVAFENEDVLKEKWLSFHSNMKMCWKKSENRRIRTWKCAEKKVIFVAFEHLKSRN